jgi:exonuclease VII small subunit
MKTDNVKEAFNLLLEEIKKTVESLNNEAANLVRQGEYEKASSLIEKAKTIREFKKKVEDILDEWIEIQMPIIARIRKITKSKLQRHKLRKGLKTPEKAFVIPILETLIEMGGRGKVSDVLKRVEEKMKHILNEYDYQPLPSSPRSVRWKNTAQWCRQMLVNRGLLRNDSPYGVWEITEEGRQFYKTTWELPKST